MHLARIAFSGVNLSIGTPPLLLLQSCGQSSESVWQRENGNHCAVVEDINIATVHADVIACLMEVIHFVKVAAHAPGHIVTDEAPAQGPGGVLRGGAAGYAQALPRSGICVVCDNQILHITALNP
jgi:hypothetical protein